MFYRFYFTTLKIDGWSWTNVEVPVVAQSVNPMSLFALYQGRGSYTGKWKVWSF